LLLLVRLGAPVPLAPVVVPAEEIGFLPRLSQVPPPGPIGPGQAPATPVPRRYVLRVSRLSFRPDKGERLALALQCSKPGPVDIHVDDKQGRTVRVLAQLNDSHGWMDVAWDGRDAGGMDAPAGAYVVVVKSPDKIEKVKITLVRQP
jgi:hypothetical protein